MRTFGRLLLFAAFALQPPLLAHAESSNPAKSAQECNDELNLNKAAIEASGETRQEFFHRCWWQSEPGKPTPIKSARDTWRPGSPKAPAKKVAGEDRAKQRADAQHASKPVVAKPVVAKPVVEKKQAEKKQPEKKLVEKKQDAPSKLPVAAPPVGVGVPAAVTAQPDGKVKVSTQDKVVASPKAAPPSASKVVVPKVSETKKALAETKKTPSEAKTSSEAKPTSEPKKATAEAVGPKAKEDAKRKQAKTPPLPADAMPPPVKGEKATKSAVTEKAKEKTSVVSREPVRHRRPGRVVRLAAPELGPFVEAPRHRHLVRRHSAPVVYDEPRFAPPRRSAPRLATRMVPRSGLPVVCIYAAPDARGRSACVPIETP